jgi:hypothetical protein
MTDLLQRAQDCANATGRPWWVAQMPDGRILTTPNLGHVAGYQQLQKVPPKKEIGS